MYGVLSLYVVLCTFSIIYNSSLVFSAEKRINQTKKEKTKLRSKVWHWQYCVYAPRKLLQT